LLQPSQVLHLVLDRLSVQRPLLSVLVVPLLVLVELLQLCPASLV
jgi:hypothetical protein